MARSIAPLLVVFILLLSSPAGGAEDMAAAAMFTIEEIAIIHDYYREHAPSAQEHHKKAKALPPGIARNLQRGKPLPPGIAKRYLPGELESALPPAPDGYERVVLDGKVLLIEIATQVVADVLSGVLER